MTNSFIKSQANSRTLLQKDRAIKLLVFTMGKLNLALHIERVQKVIDRVPVYSSGLNHMGIIHIEDKEVTVVDLHKKLFKVKQNDDFNFKNYLIKNLIMFVLRSVLHCLRLTFRGFKKMGICKTETFD